MLTPYWSFHLQMFSPIPMAIFFVFFMVSFAVWKLLKFNSVHLFIFAFISFALGDRSKKLLLQFMSNSILLMSFSRSFMASSLTFMSLIHFEFIFVYGVRKWSNLILLHIAVQFSQHHLLKRLFCLHCKFLPPLLEINWLLTVFVWVYFWSL